MRTEFGLEKLINLYHDKNRKGAGDLKGKDTIFQYPIRTECIGRPNHENTYVYACNGCGKDVRGYAQSRVRGHIWCRDCYNKRQKVYLENTRNNAVLEEIKSNLTIYKINDSMYYKVDDIFNLFKGGANNGCI